MEKLTQKWAVVALLEQVNDGDEFHYTDFPLHTTLAGVFAITMTGEMLSEGLAGLLSDQTSLKIKTDSIDLFGPNKDIKVMKLVNDDELSSLYLKVHGWLVNHGAIYNLPEYEGDGYKPHSTVQKTKALKINEVATITSISIIDLFPHNDGQQRRVFKTIQLLAR